MYYKTPSELFTSEIYKGMSIQSKMVYGILLERQESQGVLDEKGREYCHFIQAELKRLLNCHMASLKRYLKELVDFGLLEYGRKDFDKPNRIYLKKL